MKRILLGLALLSLAVPCFAQTAIINTATRLNTGSIATNRIAGQANYTNYAWVDCRNFGNIDIGFNLQRSGLGTNASYNSNVVFTIYKSINHTEVDPSPFQTITLSATTNRVSLVTNFSVVGTPWLLFSTLTNGIAASDFLTNTAVLVLLKP